MKIPGFRRDAVAIGLAFWELMAIAESDIESAHGGNATRRLPSNAALKYYDVIVDWQTPKNYDDGLFGITPTDPS